MEQINSHSKRSISQKGNLPNLQNSIMVSQIMLAVSKVDLDSRMIYKQQMHLKEMARQHDRSYSAMMKRNHSKAKLTQTTSKIFQKTKVVIQKGMHIGNQLATQIKTQITKNLKVQKSKISSRSHGFVKAYAANSHPGPYNSINEDRVCIATNITKTNIKNNEIAFFAIYDGNNGSTLADYMRDKFHHMLIEDENFSKDIESSIRNTIRKIQHSYDNDPIYSKNISQVSFIMLILIGHLGYCVQMGEPRLIISKHLGKQCSRPIENNNETKLKNKAHSFRRLQFNNQNPNRISMSNLHFQSQFREGKTVNIRKMEINDNIDFIIMGSNYLAQHRGQGLFESLRDSDLIGKTWKSLLSNQSDDSVHVRMGQASNSLYGQIFNTISTKNVSLIMIGFESIGQLIKRDQKIYLPFLDEQKP